ncbi:hypothetical protein DNTS_000355 [Danionella cerebrum]|uniref:Uncharacterized protein n=1 Tax=Danionella cerebrum TaxID=2873325 RepID=A0A553RM19_9TELE|nr:hypothetical protein DNTS_000355 [Danionella translucida]
MPKVKRVRAGSHAPLADQMLQSDAVRSGSRGKSRNGDPELEQRYVEPRLSRRILHQAREQQREIHGEETGNEKEWKGAPGSDRLGEKIRISLCFHKPYRYFLEFCTFVKQIQNIPWSICR